MTTPLQQAAQALIEHHYLPTYLDQHIAGLRKALDAEIAMTVEPVAHFNMAINETVGCIDYEYEKHNLKSGTPLYLHPPQPYDQQAMGLCSECGWKAIMPGEPCFVCNMNLDAQQAKQVPMTTEELLDLMPTNTSMTRHDALEWMARAVERRHGIHAADKPTDWSAA